MANIFGTPGNDTLTGTNDDGDIIQGFAGNDDISGLGGNDNIQGGPGNDTMRGGTGNDFYQVDSVRDRVIENLNEGNDVVVSSVSFTLPANVEVLFMDGASAIGATGNNLNNTMIGNNAANTLRGLGGNDILQGAGGNDTLAGGPGDDNLAGQTGNDILDGGPGSDVLSGGLGDDIYEVESSSDLVIEASGEGTDLVRSTIQYELPPNVEHLSLRGSASIDGIGNELNNALLGNSGANQLFGFDRNDALLGEGGDDTLFGMNGNDEINGGLGSDTLSGGEGNDIFSYRTQAEGGDTIFDYQFQSDDDTLAFSSAGFGGGLSPGETLVAGVTFISNTNPTPTTSEGTFLYDTDANTLHWDADGTGGGGSVIIVTGTGLLTTGDFLIV